MNVLAAIVRNNVDTLKRKQGSLGGHADAPFLPWKGASAVPAAPCQGRGFLELIRGFLLSMDSSQAYSRYPCVERAV